MDQKKYQPSDFIPLLHSLAQQYHHKLPSSLNLTEEDLMAMGALGLMQGFQSYDPEKCPNMPAFLYKKVFWALHDGIRKSQRCMLSLPRNIEPTEAMVSLDDASANGFEPGQNADQDVEIDKVRIREAVLSLSDERHQQVIIMYYWEGMSLAEIGATFGFTKQWAGWLLKASLEKLREHPYFQGCR